MTSHRFARTSLGPASLLRHSFITLALGAAALGAAAKDITLLNVSYDPTREFYADFNKAFAAS